METKGKRFVLGQGLGSLLQTAFAKAVFMLYILSPTPRVYQRFGVSCNTCLGE